MNKIACTLLVDDDETTNMVNQMLLEDLDITGDLLIARNGKEALDLIQQHHQAKGCYPDLILLDINMPVMDGFEFLSAFEQLEMEDKNAITIVMLTTSMNPEDVKKAQKAYIKGFLNKPLSEQDLKDVLKEHFSS
jgi:CheY-like chemotaxis protein